MACDSPYFVHPAGYIEPLPLPCGKCPPCKARRVDAWVFRLMQEEKRSTSAKFVTLTYDTTNVPITKNGFMTLEKEDFQLFMKRLRKTEPNKLKYYVAGEYGGQTTRPHYHAIIFNVESDENIQKAWGKGSLHIGQVTNDSVAYTMKYIDKPPNQKILLHSRDDRKPEFSLMSKNLGDNYLDDPQILKYHQADLSRNYLTLEGGHKIALPRYYRERIWTDDQRQAQIAIIKKGVEDAIQKDEFEYNTKGHIMQYEQHRQHQKYVRHTKFYNNHKLKSRD